MLNLFHHNNLRANLKPPDMNSFNVLEKEKAVKIIIIDFLVWFCVVSVPALSHWSPVPLYFFEPMRIFLLLGFFIAHDKRNSYFLAITIPLVSFAISGHPTIIKALLISLELVLNIVLIEILIKKWSKTALVIFASIVVSKGCYYLVKIIFVSMGFIEGSVISTPIIYQVVAGAIVSILFFVLVHSRILKWPH